MINCPNCGAPIDGHKCQYCGTVIFDFASIEVGKPIWISLKAPDGKIHMVHVIAEAMDIVMSPYTDGRLYSNDFGTYVIETAWRPPMLHLEFSEIPNNDGVCHYISERDSVSSTEIGEVDV